MTEEQLQELGFEKELLNEYEGDDTYYYALDLVDGLTFITNTSDEVKDDNWSAEVFDTSPSLTFNDFEDLKSLINLLNKGITNDK